MTVALMSERGQHTVYSDRFLELMTLGVRVVKHMTSAEVDQLDMEVKRYIALLSSDSGNLTDMFKASALGKLNAINSAIVQKRRKG